MIRTNDRGTFQGWRLLAPLLLAAGVILGLAAGQAAPAIADAIGGVTAQTREAPMPAQALARTDDYGTRHGFGLPRQSLSSADDYGLRHMAVPAPLGAADDYGLRHRD